MTAPRGLEEGALFAERYRAVRCIAARVWVALVPNKVAISQSSAALSFAAAIVVTLRAEMDAHHKGRDEGSNTVFRSLGEILHPILPQSKTSANQRIDLFRRSFDCREEVTWRLAVSQLNELEDHGYPLTGQVPSGKRANLPHCLD